MSYGRDAGIEIDRKDQLRWETFGERENQLYIRNFIILVFTSIMMYNLL